MDKELLHVLIQAIPVLAAAGGLIYAGLQFRGWRTSQYVANFTKLVELQLHLRQMIVDDPALDPTRSAQPAGSPTGEMRRHYYALMQMGVFEVAWYTHKKGQLSDDYFASWEAAMVSITKYPAFRAVWQTTEPTKILHDGFRQYVDVLIQTAVTGDEI